MLEEFFEQHFSTGAQCTVMHCNNLHITALDFIIAPFCIVIYCNALYITGLHFIAIQCSALSTEMKKS